MKILNIYGSTGTIGSKALQIVNNFSFDIKINLLVANQNYKKLATQAIKFKVNYVCIYDETKYFSLKNLLKNTNIKILKFNEINDYISKSKSDLSLLSISGYSSLKFIDSIIINTQIIGLVNKECIVSAGHIIINMCKKNKTKIFALDSEHFSIQNYLEQNNYKIHNIKNLFLTATGGPFLNKNKSFIKNATFKKAINHPKWKMGYKNSIDSATLVNKCMEIIEAYYLFNINYDKLKIIIHPEALVHSIFEFHNYTSIMNYFYHDMFIPLYNFLNTYKTSKDFKNKYPFKENINLSFYKPSYNNFPILNIFNQIDKTNPINLIKFNISNEFAVDLFSKNKIKFTQIFKIIDISMSIDVDYKINNIANILIFQDIFIKKLKLKLNVK